MTPEEVEKEVQAGTLRPVYLIVGEERQLVDQVVSLLKKKTLEGGVEGLNDDTMTAGQVPVDAVLSTARTLPMLAAKRWLLTRSIEKWDAQPGAKKKSTKKKGKSAKTTPLDRLLEYASDPSESTLLVLCASKLDKRRKLYTQARSKGFLVNCDPPKRAEIPGWIENKVRGRGNTISRSDAALLAELLGSELANIADTIERLCLYVGEGNAITDEAISECTVRVKTKTVWELVSAVGERNTARALEALDDVYDPNDRHRLLGVLAWAARQLIRFDAARKSGLSGPEAAKAAGAPPFKARELESQLRSMPPGALERWLEHLSRADLNLKGGSRRPPRAVVEQMLLDLCHST